MSDATSTRTFVFMLASTREGGNSELLARRAAAALPAGSEERWLRLTEHALPPFADTRHSTGYAAPEGNAKILCDATLAATDLVLVTPVNWYSVSWPAKLYLDSWSAWMRIPELGFRKALEGRSLWAVVVDSDPPTGGEDSAAPVIDVLRRTADYMGMRWRGALQGHGDRPGDIASDAAALSAAARFFTAP
ncbi:MAG TPA: NAD(P)H-dependent oxidoreductase [Kofleriaceae bacterium]|nr:NAD(P)H-dependent oxidoreductase [Kofleriaceae bacterium]